MDKIVFVFNKFYVSLIKEVKSNTTSELKDIVRKHYKAIDKLSSEYIEFYLTNYENKEVLKGISIDKIIELTSSPETIWNLYYILSSLALVYKEYQESDNVDDVNILSTNVLEILTKIQKGESVTDDISTILQDDIQDLLSKIKVEPPKAASPDPENPFSNMFKGMEDSKICNLAQEISKEIDVNNIKLDSTEDIMKLLDFSSSNNVMGDIIKKVSGKIHEKIANGDLKQEDLFGEAMSMMSQMNMGGGGGGMGGMAGMAGMMGNLFNNPMMGEMMKMAKKGKAKPNPEVFKGASSRDRLRQKLEKRRANVNENKL